MRRWTHHHAKTQDTFAARGFNQEYANYKSWFSGGVGRESIPAGAIQAAQILPQALQKVVLKTAIELAKATSTNLETFHGVNYGDYMGGWKVAEEVTLTGLKEGFLHIEFSCWAWINKWRDYQVQKGVRFALAVNNNTVAATANVYQGFHNPYIFADVPVPGSILKVSLLWRITNPKLTGSSPDPLDEGMMFFGGGQLLAISRWR